MLRAAISDNAVYFVWDGYGNNAVLPIWHTWIAYKEDEKIGQGSLYTAGMLPGETLCLRFKSAPDKVDVHPVRPYTPYPVSVFKVDKRGGRWSVTCSAEFTGVARFQIRAVSEKDGSPMIILQSDKPGAQRAVASIPDRWVVLQVLKESAKGTLCVRNVVVNDMATGRKYKLIAAGCKPEHLSLRADGEKLFFDAQSQAWSYFTCVPTPC